MKSLYESLQDRDAAAWDEFYEEHVRELYGFVFRLVGGDPQAAADVFQDTWLDAIGHIGQFDPQRGELRSWLFGVARRRVALHWRKRLSRSGTAGCRCGTAARHPDRTLGASTPTAAMAQDHATSLAARFGRQFPLVQADRR